MLEKIAGFYEREVDEAVDGLTAALEPMLIVFLAGCQETPSFPQLGDT
jgi:type IV pilus assembly protein PilC